MIAQLVLTLLLFAILVYAWSEYARSPEAVAVGAGLGRVVGTDPADARGDGVRGRGDRPVGDHRPDVRVVPQRVCRLRRAVELEPAQSVRVHVADLATDRPRETGRVAVGVAARLEGDVVREARIVLGAVASTPREAPKAAEVLLGRRLTTETIEAAAEAAAGPAKPLDNTDLTHPYRKKVTRVYVARALARLAGLDQSPPLEAIA